MFSKPKLIKPITTAKINEATRTNTALLCNEEYFGHVTLFFISSIDSTTKFFTFMFYDFNCTGREIRTPINGFGDRYSAIELCPCFLLQPKRNAKVGNNL